MPSHHHRRMNCNAQQRHKVRDSRMCMTLETVRQSDMEKHTGEYCSALCSVATDNHTTERWEAREITHARTDPPKFTIICIIYSPSDDSRHACPGYLPRSSRGQVRGGNDGPIMEIMTTKNVSDAGGESDDDRTKSNDNKSSQITLKNRRIRVSGAEWPGQTP